MEICRLDDAVGWRGNIMAMRDGTQRAEGAGELARGSVALASGQGDAAVLLPRIRLAGSPLSRARIQDALGRPLYGPLALGVLVLATVVVVIVASGAPSILVQGSYTAYPKWLAGPLHSVFGALLQRPDGMPRLPWQVVGWGLSGVIIVMMGAYAVALACARTLSMRTIALTIVGLYAFLALSPPLELTDVFNYLGYARLGALHGLNPYTHVIADERLDPVFWFVTWRNYPSPYGQVFTLLTYPLGFLSLPAGVWGVKIGTVLLMWAFVALVWQCARQLGHDPRFAVIFVALNPIIVIYDVGGFHNDPVMLVPMMAAISLLLARRYRWAGAALAVAIGVKATVVLLLPFMMLAARRAGRSLQVLLGTVLGLIPLAAISIAAFGFAMPNVSDQSIIVTPLSVVNLVGLLLHLGGASPTMEAASKVVMVLVVGGLLLAGLRRGRPDWLSGAGWATLALLACTAWLMPWYIVWALPLVAVSTSLRLRRAMVVFIAFATITFLPMTAMLLGDLHVNLMSSRPDQLATSRLWHFQHSPLPK